MDRKIFFVSTETEDSVTRSHTRTLPALRRQCDTVTHQDTAGMSETVDSVTQSQTRTLPIRRDTAGMEL